MTVYATRYMLETSMRPTVHDDPDCGGLDQSSEVVPLREGAERGQMPPVPEPHSRCSVCHDDSPFPLRSLLE